MKKRNLYLKTFFPALLAITTCMSVQAQSIDPGPNTGDKGEVTFSYRGNKVTYKTIRAADSNIWALQNLGSPKVADSLLDNAARGDMFQWGRWDDGHQLINPSATTASAPTPNNPSGISNGSPDFFLGTVVNGAYANKWWDNGTNNDTWTANPPSATNGLDPCAAMGEGWHIPTKEEWEKFLESEKIIYSGDAFKAIKLTHSGSRAATSGFISGATISISNGCQYWTSTPSNASAWFMELYSTTAGRMNDATTLGRGYGRTCRCMKLKIDCTPSADSIEAGLCPDEMKKGYKLPNDSTVYIAGTYINNFTKAGNCDSTIITILTEQAVDVAVKQEGTTLTAQVTGAGYQWINCETGSPVPGATRQSFEPEQTGKYAVIITQDNCSDTSDCYEVKKQVGIGSFGKRNDNIKVYPNPANSYINIEGASNLQLAVLSIEGKVLIQEKNVTTLNLESLSPGLYILRIQDQDGTRIALHKIIKAR